MPQTFVAIFRGEDVQTAHVVGVSVSPQLAATVARQMLAEVEQRHEPYDPVLIELNAGRRAALSAIAGKEARS